MPTAERLVHGVAVQGVGTLVIAALLGFAACRASARQQTEATLACQADGPVAALPDFPEASGIAASRRLRGILWALNDSGAPVLVALDSQGHARGRVRLAGAQVIDWEDIAVGPCPDGSCLYVADIGDNDANRGRITVYRAPEPSSVNTATVRADAFQATYPDGPQDAETLLVTPAGEMLVITKGDTGPIAVYRFPHPLRPGSPARLERVGPPLAAKTGNRDRQVTGGDVSPDGHWVALRTHDVVSFYRLQDLASGRPTQVSRVDVRQFREPQGEGVTFVDNDTLVLAGEGGDKTRPGTFAHLTCRERR